MSNRQYEEMIEEQGDRNLASSLGITYDELCELQWDIDTNESNDGLIYEYIITFDEDSPNEILEKIIGIDLEGRYVYLQPWEAGYDYEIKWDIDSTEQLSTLQNHLNSVVTLLESNFDKQIQGNLFVMLHAHIVAAMEGFLSSTFIHKVTNCPALIKKLIETDPEIGNKKLTLKEIHQEHENLKMTVAEYLKMTVARHLKNIIFHKIKKR